MNYTDLCGWTKDIHHIFPINSLLLKKLPHPLLRRGNCPPQLLGLGKTEHALGWIVTLPRQESGTKKQILN